MCEEATNPTPEVRYLSAQPTRHKSRLIKRLLSSIKGEEQERRLKKTRACLLDYPRDPNQPVRRDDFKDSEQLNNKIQAVDDQDKSVKFRLWVVEDLSRDVIETLGNHYDIDPSFFREHILDYVWYNISQ